MMASGCESPALLAPSTDAYSLWRRPWRTPPVRAGGGGDPFLPRGSVGVGPGVKGVARPLPEALEAQHAQEGVCVRRGERVG